MNMTTTICEHARGDKVYTSHDKDNVWIREKARIALCCRVLDVVCWKQRVVGSLPFCNFIICLGGLWRCALAVVGVNLLPTGDHCLGGLRRCTWTVVRVNLLLTGDQCGVAYGGTTSKGALRLSRHHARVAAAHGFFLLHPEALQLLVTIIQAAAT